MAHNFKVGDILHYQFHYTASFPMYFQVTRVTPCKVEVVKLGKYISRSFDPPYNQHGEEMPKIHLGPVNGLGKLCKAVGDKVLVDSCSGYWAHLWDGKGHEYYGD